ncbi:MAG: type 1 glutamine amidotransferase [Candidatus Lokiarchaeota archaeon]|nr:type 1 glutamine amidotransferase [Candidatus Lokiarchaeota archaeon]
MTKKIAFIATDGYEDLELHYPRIRLIEAGYNVELIGLTNREIKGKWGYPFLPDLSIEKADTNDYDGIIIPGGTKNPDYLRRDQKVLEFVRKINEQGKLIGAICHAGWVLISAKIVKSRKATSYFAIKDDMINAGVIFEDNAVVIDKNLITSRTPEDLPEFMKATLKFLES